MSFFRRAMDYLGLSGDETFDDYGTGNDHGNSGQKFAA